MSLSSSTPEPRRQLPNRIKVGFVRRAHGLRGEVLLGVESDNPRRFAAGSELTMVRRGGTSQPVKIMRARPHKNGLVARFEGIEERDQAEELVGAVLEVDLEHVPDAPEGTHYYFELIGCRCQDREAGDLGEVLNVVEDGGGLLLIVGDETSQVPIPFVRQFIERIDTGEGCIEFRLPTGLVETCASAS